MKDACNLFKMTSLAIEMFQIKRDQPREIVCNRCFYTDNKEV